jgi:hypothetical protein
MQTQPPPPPCVSSLSVGFIEIYGSVIRDLLVEGGAPLDLEYQAGSDDHSVKGAQVGVGSVRELLDVLAEGAGRRATSPNRKSPPPGVASLFLTPCHQSTTRTARGRTPSSP